MKPDRRAFIHVEPNGPNISPQSEYVIGLTSHRMDPNLNPSALRATSVTRLATDITTPVAAATGALPVPAPNLGSSGSHASSSTKALEDYRGPQLDLRWFPRARRLGVDSKIWGLGASEQAAAPHQPPQPQLLPSQLEVPWLWDLCGPSGSLDDCWTAPLARPLLRTGTLPTQESLAAAEGRAVACAIAATGPPQVRPHDATFRFYCAFRGCCAQFPTAIALCMHNNAAHRLAFAALCLPPPQADPFVSALPPGDAEFFRSLPAVAGFESPAWHRPGPSPASPLGSSGGSGPSTMPSALLPQPSMAPLSSSHSPPTYIVGCAAGYLVVRHADGALVGAHRYPAASAVAPAATSSTSASAAPMRAGPSEATSATDEKPRTIGGGVKARAESEGSREGPASSGSDSGGDGTGAAGKLSPSSEASSSTGSSGGTSASPDYSERYVSGGGVSPGDAGALLAVVNVLYDFDGHAPVLAPRRREGESSSQSMHAPLTARAPASLDAAAPSTLGSDGAASSSLLQTSAPSSMESGLSTYASGHGGDNGDSERDKPGEDSTPYDPLLRLSLVSRMCRDCGIPPHRSVPVDAPTPTFCAGCGAPLWPQFKARILSAQQRWEARAQAGAT